MLEIVAIGLPGIVELSLFLIVRWNCPVKEQHSYSKAFSPHLRDYTNPMQN